MRSRFRRLGALLLLVITSLGASPSPAEAAAPTLSETVVASGLAIPWDIAFLPNGNMLVTERIGRVRVFAGGVASNKLVDTITIPSVWQSGEAGLMGIAVDVDFAENQYVYVCATRSYSGSGGPKNEVLRYEANGRGGSWRNGRVILGGMAAATIHDGCALEMDRFGKLWVGMGDANVPSRAQDRNSLNGKVLRINRDGSTPSDNPIIAGTRNAVFTMGHRNPQGIAFQPGTDRVYAIEHGPAVNDEINLLTAGANYGWPNTTGVGAAWASGSSTIATSGGTFVNGAQWGDWNGHLFVSQLKQRDLRRFSLNAAGTAATPEAVYYDQTWGRLRGAVSGPGGQLYLTTSNGTNDKVIRVSPQTPTLTRLGGRNRDETAAAISRHAYPGGASDVMVATGTNFPDALAGSAVAGNFGMPLLLVREDVIPAATSTELDRLNPQRIYVLGSAGVISEDVETQLGEYAGQVIRVEGPDRYSTAANISARWYPTPGVPAAFVATGTDFPDALAGAPAAALNDSPLLLVKPGDVPDAVQAELERLNPGRIYILGGPSVVSNAVETELGTYTDGPVTRLAGVDRYATAAAVSKAFWTRGPAYVATGLNFPDALGGAAAAGRQGLPLLLVSSNAVPLHTGQELLRLGSTRITLLGSTGVVPSSVEARLKALIGTP